MDIEQALLSKVLSDSEMRPLLEHKITPEFFEITGNREVFEFIQSHFGRYAEVPSVSIIQDRFDWDPCRAAESMQFYVDEIRHAREYAIIHAALTEAKDPMRQRDPAEAKRILAHALTQSNLEISALRDFNVNADWEEWWERYNADTGLLGIPTGFPTMDYATGGLQDEQLITIVGTPKAGKSTLMLRLALNIIRYGVRVFFITFEMSADEQRMRYYSMVAGVDFERVLHRRLNPLEHRQLEKALRQNELMPQFIISSDTQGGATVSAAMSKAEQYIGHERGVVMIDGVYLMDAEVPGAHSMDPMALTALTRNLKRGAQTLRRPTVISHQVLESRYSSRRGIKSSDIGYSSSFAQDSDVIFGIERVEETESQRRLSIVLARNAAPRSTLLDWDWGTSTFTELEDYVEVDPDSFDGIPDGGDE